MMRILIVISLLFILCPGTSLAEDLRGDSLDISTVLLRIDVTDFTGKILYGDATLGIKAKVNGVQAIRLDLLLLTVDSVKINGVNKSFTYNDSTLQVNFPSTLNQNDSITIQVHYHGNPLQVAGDFGGFYWTTSQVFNIGVSFLADPHCYGRVWFPCFDNFRQRSLYEFFVTTKDIHKAFCNGLLQGVTTSGNTKTWHWKLGQKIPSYLASVAATTYQTLTDTVQGINGLKEIQLAARASDTTTVKNRFIHLRDAFHIQEQLWGPYVWDRVGFCIVPFSAGGMEHATNIGFAQILLQTTFEVCEDVMVHELSHHWFGDLVTCNTAEDMWLNEGWAVYNELLFHEKFYGYQDYIRKLRENHENVLHKTHLSDGGYLPVSGVPSAQTYGSTVYDKGGDVIHTLRHYMGDLDFFNCVKNYIRDNSFKNVTTAQLRDYLQVCSGNNLTDYFNDWIYSAGFPHFSIERVVPELVQSGPDIFTVYKLMIRQRLNNAPHFYNNVPVTISYFTANGTRTDEQIMVSGECTEHTSAIISLDEVIYIAVDFDEKIQDAITDEWRKIGSTGSYNFGTAKMILNVTSATDTSLIRVEHNWIRPEPMRTKIPGLQLHDKRYWTVDGIFNANFTADARIDFDGTDASLDLPFISNREDSLVVMYRANADSEWAFASSYFIDTLGNALNKKGTATIFGVKKGQYCLALWNANFIDNTTAENVCYFTSVRELDLAEKGFLLSPNPTSSIVTVSFDPNTFTSFDLYDMVGHKIYTDRVSANRNTLTFSLLPFKPGIYLLVATDFEGNRISKKIVRQ